MRAAGPPSCNFDVLLLRIWQVSSFYPQQEHCVRKIALRRHVKNAGLILLRRDNLVLMGMEGPSSGWERQGWWQAYQLRSRSKADLNPAYFAFDGAASEPGQAHQCPAQQPPLADCAAAAGDDAPPAQAADAPPAATLANKSGKRRAAA